MNLKLNSIILIIGIAIGYYLNKHPSPPPPKQEQEKVVEKKSGVIKKYAPPAKKGDAPVLVSEEVYVSDTKSETKSIPVEPKDNLLFLTDTKLKQADAILRIEHFHVGLGYHFKDKELLYKVGYSTRIF